MKHLWWILGIALLLGGGGVAVYRMTRGIRNNNPGNIRHNAANRWEGLAPQPSDAAGFARFVDPRFGIRALVIILRNFATRYQLNTVRGILTRYAPPTENDTDSYVAHVANALGVSPDQPIDVMGYLPQFVRAIIQHENGLQPYSDQTISEAISMAG